MAASRGENQFTIWPEETLQYVAKYGQLPPNDDESNIDSVDTPFVNATEADLAAAFAVPSQTIPENERSTFWRAVRDMVADYRTKRAEEWEVWHRSRITQERDEQAASLETELNAVPYVSDELLFHRVFFLAIQPVPSFLGRPRLIKAAFNIIESHFNGDDQIQAVLTDPNKDALREVFANLRQQTFSLERQLKTQENLIASLAGNLLSVRKTNEDLSACIAEQIHQRATLSAEKDQLIRLVAKLRRDLQAQEKLNTEQAEKFNSQLVVGNNEVNRLQEKLNKLKNELDETSGTISQLSENYNLQIKNIQAGLHGRLNEILAGDNSKDGFDIEALSQSLTDEFRKNEEYSTEIVRLQLEKQTLHNQIAELTHTQARLESQLEYQKQRQAAINSQNNSRTQIPPNSIPRVCKSVCVNSLSQASGPAI